MEIKKSDKANLENKKALFIQIGLIVALGVVICAFEHKTYDKKAEDMKLTQVVQQVDETVIQTKQDEPEPPKQEVQQQSTTEFTIVDNNVQLKNEFKIENFEQTDNTSGSVIIPKVEVATTTEDVSEETTIFQVVEQQASFPGGIGALNQYLAKNIQYPQQARQTGTQGKVYVTFVVERDGSITDIKILRDIGSGCGEEAIRVVKSMPRWQPAKQRGKVVRQQFNLPVNFTLQ
jgi:protein TonB